MSDKLKLTYFPVAGRAFALRVALFKAHGADGWVDERIKPADWGELKDKTPLGSLPVLTLPNGKQMTQTDALMRFAAKGTSLYPDAPADALAVDEIVATAFEALNKAPQSPDPNEKQLLREAYAQGFLSRALGFLEKRLGETDFYVGSDLTLADLAVYQLTDMILIGQFDHVDPTLIDTFAGIKAHADRVAKHELVVAYKEKYQN